jgi:hypothetical protein
MDARDRRDYVLTLSCPDNPSDPSPRSSTLNSLRWISAAMDAARRHLQSSDACAEGSSVTQGD